MHWVFDHVVLVVPDLDAGIQRYRAAGFTVVEGGRHVHTGVGNALISLADGSYLELFSFVDLEKAPRTHSNWPPFERGGGFGAYWFCTPDIAADTRSVCAMGVPIEDPRSGARVRPDGYEVKFRLAVPSSSERPFMPALIEDVTPRDKRVPPFQRHANGAHRVKELTVRVPELAAARAFYTAVGAICGHETATADGGAQFEARLDELTIRFVRPGMGSPDRDTPFGVHSLIVRTEANGSLPIGIGDLRG